MARTATAGLAANAVVGASVSAVVLISSVSFVPVGFDSKVGPTVAANTPTATTRTRLAATVIHFFFI